MLALAQARAWVASLIALHPGLTVDELLVVTTGDRITDRPLQEVGGKGLFLKEIEEALVAREADLAVHSIKDVPADLATGLVLAAIPVREDPRDALVSRDGAGLMSLRAGAVIGTSSLRRSLLLRRARPDITCVPLRGNVDTRLRKLEAGECDAIVLATAGLRRLGMFDRATELLDPTLSIPAVGQGALGIECRADDPRTFAIARATHHAATALCVSLERGFMRAVEGSCQVPIAAHAAESGGVLRVLAMLAEPDGSNPRFLDRNLTPPASEAEAQTIGEELGKELRASLVRAGFLGRSALRSLRCPSCALGAGETCERSDRSVERVVETSLFRRRKAFFEPDPFDLEHAALSIEARLDSADDAVPEEHRKHVISVLSFALGRVDLPDVVEPEEVSKQAAIPHQRVERCEKRYLACVCFEISQWLGEQTTLFSQHETWPLEPFDLYLNQSTFFHQRGERPGPIGGCPRAVVDLGARARAEQTNAHVAGQQAMFE